MFCHKSKQKKATSNVKDYTIEAHAEKERKAQADTNLKIAWKFYQTYNEVRSLLRINSLYVRGHLPSWNKNIDLVEE